MYRDSLQVKEESEILRTKFSIWEDRTKIYWLRLTDLMLRLLRNHQRFLKLMLYSRKRLCSKKRLRLLLFRSKTLTDALLNLSKKHLSSVDNSTNNRVLTRNWFMKTLDWVNHSNYSQKRTNLLRFASLNSNNHSTTTRTPTESSKNSKPEFRLYRTRTMV